MEWKGRGIGSTSIEPPNYLLCNTATNDLSTYCVKESSGQSITVINIPYSSSTATNTPWKLLLGWLPHWVRLDRGTRDSPGTAWLHPAPVSGPAFVTASVLPSPPCFLPALQASSCGGAAVTVFPHSLDNIQPEPDLRWSILDYKPPQPEPPQDCYPISSSFPQSRLLEPIIEGHADLDTNP
jgi:hypothetical protein